VNVSMAANAAERASHRLDDPRNPQDEVTALQAEWRRLWGHQYQYQEQELPYWSVDDSNKGGVAILLNPSGAGIATPWKPEEWSTDND